MGTALVNEAMYQLGSEPSAIRELFAYGLARKAEIGDNKVFDFSLGNPSIPAPDAVKDAIVDLLDTPPLELHGYTPAQGTPGVRAAIAASINRRFGMRASADLIYMTAGAAASLAIAIKAISSPGDEFLVISPYFPEYRVWIEAVGCSCVEVPARADDFQLDIPAIEATLSPRTRGIIINSPNNPTGVVYPESDLRVLSAVLAAAQDRFDREIYLISDEPYREIVYNGTEVPFIPVFYDNTIVCYSYSKSLSLPGERIGYIYVSERTRRVGEAAQSSAPSAAVSVANGTGDAVGGGARSDARAADAATATAISDAARRVFAAVCGAGRALGFVCAPSLFQQVIERCVDAPVDVESYAHNRALLCQGLSELGYEYVEPQGAFYLWVRSFDPDEQAFAERAKAHELLLVPSTSFGCSGFIRIGYCVSAETIERSMPAFAALAAEYRDVR